MHAVNQSWAQDQKIPRSVPEACVYLECMPISERGHEWASAVSLEYCHWGCEDKADSSASFGVPGVSNH